MGGGLASLHCQTKFATETPTKNSNISALGADGPPVVSTAGGSMTRDGQSRKEAVLPTTILSTRATTKIGTWNVRTMYESGKPAQVANEMQAYCLDILGISEARWKGSGHLQLESGVRLLYSGHEEEGAPHTEGVAIMLSKKAQRSFIGW